MNRKNRKMYSNIAKILAGSLAVAVMAFSSNVFALQAPKLNKKEEGAALKHHLDHKHHIKKTEKGWKLPKGWKLDSIGGLSYEHPDDPSYWFKLSGLVRLDDTVLMGSYRDKKADFPTGSNLRTAELYFDGGVGEFWEYTLTLGFKSSSVYFGDTWLSYSGFLDNNQVFVGRVPGQWFGLDSSNSGSWNPFLERSLPILAFYPGDGLGVMTDFWWDNGAITLTAMQPDVKNAIDPNSLVDGNANNKDVMLGVRDRWKGTVRLTMAPIHDPGDVWHFGVSGAYREVVSAVNGVAITNIIGFSTYPSARARNTASLLNTSYDGNTPVSIRANNVRLFNVEAARQIGPFMLEGEYTNVFVHRVGDNLGTLRFEGYNIQTRYLLTGESHSYDVRDGNFGSIKPRCEYGAFEVAARYDFIELNDKNIRGGSEHNVTVGLNWFLNQNVRLSANYICAAIHPANDLQKRNLDILGMRLQIRFK